MATRKEILDQLARGEIDVERAASLLNDLRDSHSPAPAEPAAPPPIPVPPSQAVAPGAPPQPAAPPIPAPPQAEIPSAPPAPSPAAPVRPAPPPRHGMRWLRIHVSALDSGRSRVRVNVPLGLVQFGLRLGARFTDEIDSTMVRELLDALREQSLTGTLVEVEDEEDNERVHIFID